MVPDGELLELINLRFKNGALRPVPSKVRSSSPQVKIIYKHVINETTYVLWGLNLAVTGRIYLAYYVYVNGALVGSGNTTFMQVFGGAKQMFGTSNGQATVLDAMLTLWSNALVGSITTGAIVPPATIRGRSALAGSADGAATVNNAILHEYNFVQYYGVQYSWDSVANHLDYLSFNFYNSHSTLAQTGLWLYKFLWENDVVAEESTFSISPSIAAEAIELRQVLTDYDTTGHTELKIFGKFSVNEDYVYHGTIIWGE